MRSINRGVPASVSTTRMMPFHSVYDTIEKTDFEMDSSDESDSSSDASSDSFTSNDSGGDATSIEKLHVFMALMAAHRTGSTGESP